MLDSFTSDTMLKDEIKLNIFFQFIFTIYWYTRIQIHVDDASYWIKNEDGLYTGVTIAALHNSQ